MAHRGCCQTTYTRLARAVTDEKDSPNKKYILQDLKNALYRNVVLQKREIRLYRITKIHQTSKTFYMRKMGSRPTPNI